MALLAEYALTPDVFDSTSYSDDEVGDIRLQNLKEVLLSEGLVRNLCDGIWLSRFADDGRLWHRRGQELLKKLFQQGRLRPFPKTLPNEANTDCEWCSEALASHGVSALDGIIATRSVADSFCDDKIVAPIDRLTSALWWSNRSPSVRLVRNISKFKENLQLILNCSNSLMFIDPHLDPSQHRYREFLQLLLSTAGRIHSPLIEIHRVCYIGSGPSRTILSEDEWKSVFQGAWASELRSAGFSLEVFIWDDFHDRYLISNLIGISVPYGFDTTTSLSSITTWTRLGRQDRDNIQREFDLASNRHVLRGRFRIPWNP